MDKTVIWTPPQLYINCSVYVWGRVQGSQIFKWNSIILMHSKVMAFLVISLSPWSPHCPRDPHVIPIIPTSSPSSPHCPCHPHIIPIAPRRSPCGPHGCCLHGLHPMLSPSCPSSPHHPCHPHINSMLSRRFPHHLQLPRYPLHPLPPPGGMGGPESVKLQ